MTNTGKVLIVGLVFVDVVFSAYFLSGRDDQSAINADAATNSYAAFGVADSLFGDPHVAAGRVISAAPAVTSTADTASAPKQSLAGNVPIEAGPSASGAEQELRPEAQAAQQSGRTLEPVDAPGSFVSKPGPVPRTGNRRDSLHLRHLRARGAPYRRGSDPVAAAMTDRLVRESTRLDPALPQPNPPSTK